MGPLGTPYYGVFNASIITTNGSKQAKSFFKLYREIVSQAPYSWYSDQEGLYLAFQEQKHSLSFKPLDTRFCDRRNTDSTIIWTAKGNLKELEDYVLISEKNIRYIRQWNSLPVVDDNPKMAIKPAAHSFFSKAKHSIINLFKYICSRI